MGILARHLVRSNSDSWLHTSGCSVTAGIIHGDNTWAVTDVFIKTDGIISSINTEIDEKEVFTIPNV